MEKSDKQKLDDNIRIYATARYYSHSSYINYYAKFENMEITATFGAGTNSARVQIPTPNEPLNPTVLYEASDYGRHITVFRYGPWVRRLIDEVECIQAVNEAQQRNEQRRMANFEEVDF